MLATSSNALNPIMRLMTWLALFVSPYPVELLTGDALFQTHENLEHLVGRCKLNR